MQLNKHGGKNERSQECVYYPHEGGLTQIEPPDLDRTEQTPHSIIVKAFDKSYSGKKGLETAQ